MVPVNSRPGILSEGQQTIVLLRPCRQALYTLTEKSMHHRGHEEEEEEEATDPTYTQNTTVSF